MEGGGTVLGARHNCHYFGEEFVVAPVNETLFLLFLDVEVPLQVIELLRLLVFDLMPHGYQFVNQILLILSLH